MSKQRTPLAERFWKYVNKTEGCWLWTGARREFGYGVINTGGKHGKAERAHRVSWLIHHGEVPEGLCVCHRCDNPICVNPDHLFLGTRTDNNRDMQQKGRCDRVKRPKGEQHGCSKLTAAQVKTLLAEYRPDVPLRVYAEQLGVSIQTIHRIVRGKGWKCLRTE